MRQIFLILFLAISLNSFCQSDYDKSVDKENGSVVFKGQCSFDDLLKEPDFAWFNNGADSYQPDSNAILFLKKHLPDYDLVVLMGTWCEDSQNLVPKLYKTLQLTGYPISKLKLFGVDRAKEAKFGEHKLYKVEKVPTIILFRQKQEISRLVEIVEKSIEKDLVKLIEVDLKTGNQ